MKIIIGEEELKNINFDSFFRDSFKSSPTTSTYYFNRAGDEHYRLLSFLSTQFNNTTIFDVGTAHGNSALSLSYNPSNTVYTFDIKDTVANNDIRQKENITRSLDNLFDKITQQKWLETILSASFIFLDVDPHNGTMEYDFYKFLKDINYQGFLICDDVHHFAEMRDNFWNKIPASEKVDLTKYGHWSGTGVVVFSDRVSFSI
jgi:predicted O-methyltransferase YrrM